MKVWCLFKDVLEVAVQSFFASVVGEILSFVIKFETSCPCKVSVLSDNLGLSDKILDKMAFENFLKSLASKVVPSSSTTLLITILSDETIRSSEVKPCSTWPMFVKQTCSLKKNSLNSEPHWSHFGWHSFAKLFQLYSGAITTC